MRIKRIEADSVNEAMLMLRRELGEHAIILHTKQLPARGVTAWFKTPRIEILGAVDEPMMKTGIEVIGGLPTLDRGYYETPRGAAAPAPMRQDHLTRERINHVAAEHREPATSSGTGSRAGATPFEGTGSRAGATPVPATKKAGPPRGRASRRSR
ncbi:MAG: hypothetical protein HY216_11840 [Candidatus Rokubacteria bacterium]|nr:hypothetical protein [Candidatus Rokubacteria bacterium]